MVYISTNEVFDGRAIEPYTEDDKPAPINPYGSSKRTGEQMSAHYSVPDSDNKHAQNVSNAELT